MNASHALTPEVVFEKRWAATVLQRVLDRLRADFKRAGKSRQFELLKTFLMGDEPALSYRQVAADLEMTEGAVKMAVHRPLTLMRLDRIDEAEAIFETVIREARRAVQPAPQ